MYYSPFRKKQALFQFMLDSTMHTPDVDNMLLLMHFHIDILAQLYDTYNS